MEKVLVVYDYNKHKKDFLPRFPNTLQNIQISKNGSFFGVQTFDNFLGIFSKSEFKKILEKKNFNQKSLQSEIFWKS